jgi:hypothetical protein
MTRAKTQLRPSSRRGEVLKPLRHDGRQYEIGDAIEVPGPVLAGLIGRGEARLAEDIEHGAGVYVAVDHLMLGLHGEIQPGQEIPPTWRTPDAKVHDTDFADLIKRGLAAPSTDTGGR